jgi:hypothetical protein
MTWTPTLGPVLARLKVIWLAAPIGDADVIRGPTVGVGADGVLTIAYQDETLPQVGDGTSSTEGFVGNPTREQYSVNCAAGVINGDGDIEAATDAACALWAAAGFAIVTDPHLGTQPLAPSQDLVLHASMGAWSLQLTQAADGAQAVVLFNVDIDAYTITT